MRGWAEGRGLVCLRARQMRERLQQLQALRGAKWTACRAVLRYERAEGGGGGCRRVGEMPLRC